MIVAVFPKSCNICIRSAIRLTENDTVQSLENTATQGYMRVYKGTVLLGSNPPLSATKNAEISTVSAFYYVQIVAGLLQFYSVSSVDNFF